MCPFLEYLHFMNPWLLTSDDEAVCLSKAARIIRRDMLVKKSTFNRFFERGCQKDAVPTTPVAMMQMIMDGTTAMTIT